MKRFVLIAIALLFVLNGCNGQAKSNENTLGKSKKPEPTITVNKEYDKNGNLIKFDSTYSMYYSNIEKNKLLADSVLNKVKDEFNQNYMFSRDAYFKNFFFQDSLLKYDFYKNDFFIKRFRDNVHRMDSLFMQMDQFKNNFFLNEFNESNRSKPKK